MARVTSARDRSKRKTKKTITTSKGRANRSSVSNAKVTSASNGKSTGSGSAKVTQSQSNRTPRDITNGRSNTMRNVRAKAAQARRMSQRKSTLGGASRAPVKLPNSQRAGVNLPRTGAQVERQATAGQTNPAAQARARQEGQRNVAQAQARRGARAASARMSNTLAAARTGRAAASVGRLLPHAYAVWEGLQANNTAKGTLTEAAKRGDLAKRRKPTPTESASYRKQEATARAKNAKRRDSSFDDAFASARKAGMKTFTWKGKKYTTEMK